MPDTRARHDIHVSSAILGADLTQAEKMVYIAIRSRQGAGRWCFATQQKLADDIGSSKSYVNRAVKTLAEAGWIERGEGRNLRCNDTAGGASQVTGVAQQATGGGASQTTPGASRSTAVAQQAPPTESQQENQQLKPTTPSPARAREADPPDPPPLAFLAKRDEPQRAAIEFAAEQMSGDLADPAGLAAQCEREWNRHRPISPREFEKLLSTEQGRHHPEAVLAALVIAGDDESPNRGYFSSILKRLHAQQQLAQQGLPPNASRRSRGASAPDADDGGRDHRGGHGGPGGRRRLGGRSANRSRGAVHAEC